MLLEHWEENIKQSRFLRGRTNHNHTDCWDILDFCVLPLGLGALDFCAAAPQRRNREHKTGRHFEDFVYVSILSICIAEFRIRQTPLYIRAVFIWVFSFECRKTKTKVITLTNHNSRKQFNKPIRARSKYMSPVPSADKRVRVSGASFFNQSQSAPMQN